ncbi:MAG: hypothetical protein QNL57_00630, partial [Alphaproteobacteria bacterium]
MLGFRRRNSPAYLSKKEQSFGFIPGSKGAAFPFKKGSFAPSLRGQKGELGYYSVMVERTGIEPVTPT